MQVPKRRGEQEKRQDTGSFTVTAGGLADLKKNLAELERALPALIAEVMRTKENGDLSENFEYQDAKHTLRNTHSRIANIKHRIEHAVLITKGPSSGRVELGSTVVLETGGREVVYTILGSYESSPAEGKISDRSPLGAALLGRSAGDSVTITTKNGSVAYRIVKIR